MKNQFEIGDIVMFQPKYPFWEEVYVILPPPIGSLGFVVGVEPDNPTMHQFGLDRMIAVQFEDGKDYPIPDIDLVILEKYS